MKDEISQNYDCPEVAVACAINHDVPDDKEKNMVDSFLKRQETVMEEDTRD